jgi:hypothetical protein
MKTPQLIKTLFAAAVLLSALSGIAQTNATYLNIRSMTVGTPATLDYMIFGKASGTNYYWNRQYVGDFYNAVTNFPAGAWLRSNVVLNAANLATETAARIAASNSISASVTNEAAARVATSNALQSAISSATAQTLAGSNALSLAISNTAAAAYPSNNPNGFQTASQVAAAAASAAAQAVATGTTTGASVTFSAVKYVVLDKGTNNSPVIDLSTNSIQLVSITGNCSMSLTNITPGANVTVILKNCSSSFLYSFRLPANVKRASGTGYNLDAGRWAVISFTAFGDGSTNVLAERAHNTTDLCLFLLRRASRVQIAPKTPSTRLAVVANSIQVTI